MCMYVYVYDFVYVHGMSVCMLVCWLCRSVCVVSMCTIEYMSGCLAYRFMCLGICSVYVGVCIGVYKGLCT